MRKTPALSTVLIFALAVPLLAQRERQVPPPSASEKNFFDQLRNLFGRFQEGDLRRSFQNAQPLKCSTLVSDTGEWRPVAFFNEDRRLGAGYNRSLEEVKREIDLYTFKGTCGTGNQDDVQVVTKFPTRDSLDKYAAGRIELKDVDVNVNAPVTAKYNPRSEGYRFELPYLYTVPGKAGVGPVYSLRPVRSTDPYVTHLTNHWDCKSVRANDVTFQFLICETAVLPLNMARGKEAEQSFGTYAYIILSDGKEALTSAKLSFGTPGNDDNTPATPEPDPTPARLKDTTGIEAWQIPRDASKLAEVDKTEFRIRFSPQTWTSKLAASQILSDQKMSGLDPTKVPVGMDYCAWRPAAVTFVTRVLGNEPDEEVSYSVTALDSPVSVSFDMKTHNGARLGTLQCVFPKETSAAGIAFEKWVAVVGAHLTLEVRP
jgi:hypothetical protein